MTVTRWAGLALLAAAFLSGCQRHIQPPPPKPLPMPVGTETRARIMQMSPKAIIGQVIAVLPSEQLAAVADVQVKDFREGDVLTFLGGEEFPLCNGVVVAIVKDTLHVRYEEPAANRRAPVIGDLAVHFVDSRP